MVELKKIKLGDVDLVIFQHHVKLRLMLTYKGCLTSTAEWVTVVTSRRKKMDESTFLY